MQNRLQLFNIPFKGTTMTATPFISIQTPEGQIDKERVLAFRKEDLLKYLGGTNVAMMDASWLNNITARFDIGRPYCETREDIVHVVTYVAIADKNTGNILRYRRGKKGAETGLHDKYSIGVGGHVTIPQENPERYTALDLVIRSLADELLEEVGLCLNTTDLEAVRNTLSSKPEQDKWQNTVVLYDGNDSVGKYHLGVCCVLFADPAEITQFEESVLTEPEWVSISDLESQNENGEKPLENWSATLISVAGIQTT